MRTSRIPAVVVLIAVLAAACQAPERVLSDEANLVHADTPIITGSSTYSVAVEDGRVSTDIDIRFRNLSSETFYIVNCNGLLAPQLQKLKRGEWVPYWTPALPECLSEPIVIPAGDSIVRTIQVRAALPAAGMHPEWGGNDVAGTYRIVLHHVVRNYDSEAQGFGGTVPVEQRVSNTFQLTL